MLISAQRTRTYPLTISEITEDQASHQLISKYFNNKPFKGKDGKINPKVMADIRVLTYKH